ncbi:MAG: hypothetical protein C0432_00245 [Candidatus Puniceispirillum sp.]|nr:hypothetical protein [Candidatus Pelagibacter sp.]MBA4282712.1 hypothetical protein [Candidatus Puniceispirillum sp.]
MHIHCPNCKASFTVESGKLPTPKFNTSLQAFGWKFECGQCDTQWWICLSPSSADQASAPTLVKKETKPSPLLQDLITLGASNTYSGMNELLTVPTPKRISQPITFPSEETTSYTSPRLQNIHESKTHKLRYEPLYKKKKSFSLLKFIASLVIIFSALLTFEFFYPKKINKTIKHLYSTISLILSSSSPKKITPASNNPPAPKQTLPIAQNELKNSTQRILPVTPLPN